MKKPVLFLILFSLCLGPGLYADEAEVVYIDGWVDIKNKAGSLVEAWEGDMVYTGESVITDSSSFAELEGVSGTIKISPDTVFTMSEINEGGQSRTVLSTAVGSVAYKFGKTVGTEPYIRTQSMVAGVRGTEFTVFAGVDGSTLVAVESGQVDVTSGGEVVELYPEEGVEVRPGETPGEKFEVLRGKIDYSTWNSDKFDEFLEDPAAAGQRVAKQIDEYIAEIDALQPVYDGLRNELEKNREEYNKIRDEQGKDAAKPFYVEKIEPIMLQTAPMFTNLRFYALSSLSMRRFVLGKLYMEMKSRYIMNGDDPRFTEFLKIYEDILEKFEHKVVPLLVTEDI